MLISLTKLGIIAATSVVAGLSAPGVISVAGFGAAGVVGGSVAAGIQAMIGNVAAGSAFAAMQSIGAVGLGLAGQAVVGAAAGAITLLAL